MKKVIAILKNDIRSIFSHVLIFVIFAGVCFLPALYAWCNIYSNWDPYSNTGNLKMAVISLDEDYTDSTAGTLNVGNQFLDGLKENKSIDWVFPDSREELVAGVEKGEYYGAVVVPADFTKQLFDVLNGNTEHPKLIFYQNQKLNPVATKITDAVVEKLQATLVESIIDALAKAVFTKADDIAVKLDDADSLKHLISRIDSIRSGLSDYHTMIRTLITSNETILTALSYADASTQELTGKMDLAAEDIAAAGKAVSGAGTSVSTYVNNMGTLSNALSTKISGLSSSLDQLGNTVDVDKLNTVIQDIAGKLSDIDVTLEALDSGIPDLEVYRGLRVTLKDLDGSTTRIGEYLTQLNDSLSEGLDQNAVTKLIGEKKDSIRAEVDKLKRSAADKLLPELRGLLRNAGTVIDNLTVSVNNLAEAFGGMGEVYTALSDAINSADGTLQKVNDAIEGINEKLTGISEILHAISDAGTMDKLIEILSSSPELYGDFFSNPVTVEENIVYPVKNYGSAVAPFYTVLAIWVGCLLLTAILRTSPDRSRYPDAGDTAIFFGRYLIFLLAAILQTTIIVLGDFYLLGIQCEHKVSFYLASLFTSLVFSLLIYSLVNAFGDIGKCLAVVIVVIQIAGSSGTYPIELLPQFFKRAYLFFPFPYAINALRECIGGMYGHDYSYYLLQLSVFLLVALVIGLIIRKAFAGINHFIEKRMEDTGMM